MIRGYRLFIKYNKENDNNPFSLDIEIVDDTLVNTYREVYRPLIKECKDV